MLDPYDVLDAERQLLEIALEDGPYDGILGYSQGATFAAQTVIQHIIENPRATIQEMPFRFAIFFNGATPSRVSPLTEEPRPIRIESDPEAINFYKVQKANPILHSTAFYPAALSNGRNILTDGQIGMIKCDPDIDGTMIKIPTLHVRCPTDNYEHGLELQKLCEPSSVQEYFHGHGHDFPRVCISAATGLF